MSDTKFYLLVSLAAVYALMRFLLRPRTAAKKRQKQALTQRAFQQIDEPDSTRKSLL